MYEMQGPRSAAGTYSVIALPSRSPGRSANRVPAAIPTVSWHLQSLGCPVLRVVPSRLQVAPDPCQNLAWNRLQVASKIHPDLAQNRLQVAPKIHPDPPGNCPRVAPEPSPWLPGVASGWCPPVSPTISIQVALNAHLPAPADGISESPRIASPSGSPG
jgi:hypothetical protein